MATTSRVSAGLRASKVCPLADSTHSPSMKFLKTLVLVVPPSITGLVMVSVAIGMPPEGIATFNANNGRECGQGEGAWCGQFKPGSSFSLPCQPSGAVKCDVPPSPPYIAISKLAAKTSKIHQNAGIKVVILTRNELGPSPLFFVVKLSPFARH